MVRIHYLIRLCLPALAVSVLLAWPGNIIAGGDGAVKKEEKIKRVTNAAKATAPTILKETEKPAHPAVSTPVGTARTVDRIEKIPRTVLANNSAEAGYLREAYGILETADHDYKGHRAAAMRQIGDAAKRFGVELRGDGRGREPQRNSDEALRAALGLLSDITGAVAGEGLVHVRNAIEQLNVALAIK